MRKPNSPPEKQGFVARADGSRFAREHEEIWKFIKFTGVSILCAALELVTQLAAIKAYTALGVEKLPGFFRFLAVNVEERPGVSLAVLVCAFMTSTFVGYTLGFFVNRKATFHADSSIVLGTVLNVALIVVVVVANSFIGPAVTGLMLRLDFVPDSLVDTLSKVLSMMATGIIVYPANRFVIHRKTKEGAK